MPKNLYDIFTSGTITIEWTRPENEGGWPVIDYLIWVTDEEGVWPAEPVV
jgi:hypothetical protein